MGFAPLIIAVEFLEVGVGFAQSLVERFDGVAVRTCADLRCAQPVVRVETGFVALVCPAKLRESILVVANVVIGLADQQQVAGSEAAGKGLIEIVACCI